MFRVLDVVSKDNKIIRFLYTPANTINIFGTIRNKPVVTVFLRSIPCHVLKEHGTLLWGDLPENVYKSTKNLRSDTNISVKTTNFVIQWIKNNQTQFK